MLKIIITQVKNLSEMKISVNNLYFTLYVFLSLKKKTYKILKYPKEQKTSKKQSFFRIFKQFNLIFHMSALFKLILIQFY